MTIVFETVYAYDILRELSVLLYTMDGISKSFAGQRALKKVGRLQLFNLRAVGDGALGDNECERCGVRSR